MAVMVYIPTSFRRATNNRDRVEVAASDVSRLLDQLEASYGGLKGSCATRAARCTTT